MLCLRPSFSDVCFVFKSFLKQASAQVHLPLVYQRSHFCPNYFDVMSAKKELMVAWVEQKPESRPLPQAFAWARKLSKSSFNYWHAMHLASTSQSNPASAVASRVRITQYHRHPRSIAVLSSFKCLPKESGFSFSMACTTPCVMPNKIVCKPSILITKFAP